MTAAASTLLVFAHPALERARINPAMARAAAGLPGVTLHDLYEAYPEFTPDVGAEQALLTAHAVILLQFPLYWYSCPALLKEWLDLVWLHGFAYGRNGDRMQGKVLACAVSTGGDAAAYETDGRNRHTVAEFLRPFEATARLCGMRWVEPFAVHGAAVLDEADLMAATRRYADFVRGLQDLAATTTVSGRP